ncbi:hypothetical protein HNR22_004473 [Micromonospora jinlongensis]|uniref:Self-protective colicin-like immunity n=1 Tax=Micromonospora jinlongensis TaxID=1287877 RepID=A0A7Y9X3S0_9ACTN|nr:hypothetical protein [Micromonospora jinlongensis]NYH44746.1 hypothetical protein [Micromonospora jinlongensis]
MSAKPAPPDPAEVVDRFVAILDGSQSRDEVDRWATDLMRGPEDVEVDEAVRWALGILAGIDLRHGQGEPYLHDDTQVLGWLAEFRERRGMLG